MTTEATSTDVMSVLLSSQPADARWGEKALLSTDSNGINIHFSAEDKLTSIARAARRIDGQGVKKLNWPEKAGIWKTAGHSGRDSVVRKAPAVWIGPSCPMKIRKLCNNV